MFVIAFLMFGMSAIAKNNKSPQYIFDEHLNVIADSIKLEGLRLYMVEKI